MSDSDEVNEEIEQVLEGVRSGVESGTAIAENVEALANGEGGGPASIGEVTSGVGTGLDALGDGLEELGVDSQIVGAIETLGDLAPLVGAAIEGGEALVDAVHAIESALRSDRRRVEYDIDLPGGGDVHWRVSEVEVREKLGRTYAATVRIRTEQLDARPMELLGTDATLTMRRGESDSVHPIHGIVSAVGRGGEHDRQLDAIIEIVPALELMRHVRDSRIFQELSAVQIIHAAVGAHLSEYGREIRLDLEREDDHVRRECCVQYQETVLDFFHRLIEEEGLTYYFDQSGEHEVVVVVDDNSRLASAPLMPDANGAPYVPGATGNTVIGEEPVRALTASEQLGPTSLTIADFDWTADRLPFSAEQRTTDAQGRGREEYIHDRATVVAGYDESKGKYQTFDYKHRLDRGRERQAMAGLHFSGRSEVVGLYAGSLLRVVDHPELDGEYLITQVTHTGRDHNLGDDDVNAAVRERPEYENRFGVDLILTPRSGNSCAGPAVDPA